MTTTGLSRSALPERPCARGPLPLRRPPEEKQEKTRHELHHGSSTCSIPLPHNRES